MVSEILSSQDRRKSPRLSDRARKFARLFALCGNASQAYMKAYGEKSRVNASANGYRLLHSPKMRAAIARMQDHYGLDELRIGAEMARLVGLDLADCEPWLKGEKSLAELRDAGIDTAAIESVSVKPTKFGESRSIKRVSRADVLMNLARLRGLVRDPESQKAAGPTNVAFTFNIGRLDNTANGNGDRKQLESVRVIDAGGPAREPGT